jgi:hypothetical protein
MIQDGYYGGDGCSVFFPLETLLIVTVATGTFLVLYLSSIFVWFIY